MLFYWIIFIIVAYCAIFVPRKNKQKAYLFLFWLLFLLGATRAASVGTDIKGYSAEFYFIMMNPNTWRQVMGQFELGFAFFMAFFKTYICSEPIYFFHLIFAITFILCCRIIKRYSVDPALSLLFLLGFAYYFSFYNTMRQDLCFTIVSSFLPLVIEKKEYFKFALITIIVSYFIHKSQMVLLIFIPVVLYYNDDIFSTKKMILYLLVSSVVGITCSAVIFQKLGFLATFYQGGNSNFANYLTDSDQMGQYSNLSNILNTLFAIYIVITHRFERTVFLVIYVIGIILLNLLTPISWIFMRIAFTFMYFRIFTYAYMWYKIPNKYERYLYRCLIIIFTIVMFNNRLINDHYEDVVPYVNHYFSTF